MDTALETMFSSLARLRLDPQRLVVKVFGGSNGIMTSGRGNVFDIGGRNVTAVRRWLMNAGVAIAKTDVGGTQGRKLLFLTHTGDVWVKRLNRAGEARP